MSVFRGTLVDTPAPGVLRVRVDHVLAVERGRISYIGPASSPSSSPYTATTEDTATTKDTPTAKDTPTTHLSAHSFLLPTFTDLHLHAPQYLYAGTGLDLPLMAWLERYAYAAEERIDADPDLAERVYGRLGQRLVEGGTGCVVAFGGVGVGANPPDPTSFARRRHLGVYRGSASTKHLVPWGYTHLASPLRSPPTPADASLILARACLDAGIRGFIGKVSMDESPRPTYGDPSTSHALAAVHSFLDGMAALVAPLPEHLRLVAPVITPRFVPVCSDGLLRGLAEIARTRGVMIQSHMCESRDQMAWVESTRGREDEVVFDQAGLLTPSTVQAHVTSLPPRLIDLVKARGVTIAHCPLSNAYFSDAAFPLREALDAGCKTGLGSDIAGGYALPLQVQMRQAVVVARLREGARRERVAEAEAEAKAKAEARVDANAGAQTEADVGAKAEVKVETSASSHAAPTTAPGIATTHDHSHDKGLRVDWTEALYLATRGGKGALGLGGAFEAGMEFDAQMITLAEDGRPTGPVDIFDLPASPDEAWWTEAVERWWCNGDDRNRTGMWVQGRRLR